YSLANVALLIHYSEKTHHFPGINSADNIQDKKVFLIVDQCQHSSGLPILFLEKDIEVPALMPAGHYLLQFFRPVLLYNILKIKVFAFSNKQQFHFLDIFDSLIKRRIFFLVDHAQGIVVKEESARIFMLLLQFLCGSALR